MDRAFVKKAACLLCDRELEPDRAFAVIDAEKATHSITRMTELLAVSRSGYYAWAAREDAPPGPRAARNAELTAKILDLVERRFDQGQVNYPVLKEPGLQLLSLAGCQVSRRARGQ